MKRQRQIATAFITPLALPFLLITGGGCSTGIEHLVAKDAEVKELVSGLGFLEGPVTDKEGNLYFSDIKNRKIYKWTTDNELKVHRADSGGSNGLAFDHKGNMIVCEDKDRRLVSISPSGKVTVLADSYNGKKLNGPNDLWIAPNGGIYFTDPLYWKKKPELDGDYVYYMAPGSKELQVVVKDLEKPNGILGLPNGKKLYVADRGSMKDYVYDVNADGSLSNKRLFAEEGSDGMAMDELGNVYITSRKKEPYIIVFSPKGRKLGEIVFPQKPTNLHFGGKDRKRLYVTAMTSLYVIQMKVKGIAPAPPDAG